MAFAYVLDDRIVNYKGENDWPPLVAPHATGDGALIIVVLADALFQEIV